MEEDIQDESKTDQRQSQPIRSRIATLLPANAKQSDHRDDQPTKDKANGTIK